MERSNGRGVGVLGSGAGWAACVAAAVLLSGCGSSAKVSDDPIADLRNPTASKDTRLAAVEAVWAQAEADPSMREAARKALKDTAWATNNAPEVRARAMEMLFSDPTPEGQADNREMARFMLPRDPSRTVVAVICKEAADRKWTDFDGALVRSWSRPNEAVKDDERAERTAIQSLFPERSVEQVVFDVFVNPPPAEPTFGMKWEDRVRADAWDLLARLDKDGSRRTALLSSLEGAPAGNSSETIEQLRSAVRDLRAIPLTGAELRWLSSLRDPGKPQNQQWWGEAAGVIRGLDGERGRRMALRHAEPVRWAARYKPEYLSATREELLSALEQRLESRPRNRRTADLTEFKLGVKETLEVWREELRFADLVAVLVIDDAVRSPSVRSALFTQSELDRRDTSTEYGGVLSSDAEGVWVATMYPPRPSQRIADNKFVASEEMMTRSDRSLAHYHFHAQRVKNSDYAGPSDGDLEYALTNGRACLVFTSLREGVLGVDYYQPDGIVIDLGEITSPGSAER